jgi:uncharacterized protein YecE (DUF72 family)
VKSNRIDPAFRIGCPAWSVPAWRGGFFPARTRSGDFLSLYARVFRTVEANGTFYAVPGPDTARRWADVVSPEFRFCFKVPRVVSHDAGLLARPEALRGFLRFLEVFGEAARLGPAFLQVHDSFGPERLAELASFLGQWPHGFPLAVEVRHPDWFTGGAEEARLGEVLREHGAGRILFDSRALYHAPPEDAAEAESQRRKPRRPVRWETMRDEAVPFLRFVGRNRVEQADPWLAEAAREVAGWIREGKRPYVFLHAPDDVFAPTLCARFQEHLGRELPGVPPLDLTAARDQPELF